MAFPTDLSSIVKEIKDLLLSYEEEVQNSNPKIIHLHQQLLNFDSTIKCVVCGENSVGKTMLLNAILKRQLLPYGSGITTKRQVVINGTDREEIQYVKDEENRENFRSHIKMCGPSTYIHFPISQCPMLEYSCVLIDTPYHRLCEDRPWEKDADLLILVLPALRNASSEEKNIVKTCSAISKMVVWTFVDQCKEEMEKTKELHANEFDENDGLMSFFVSPIEELYAYLDLEVGQYRQNADTERRYHDALGFQHQMGQKLSDREMAILEQYEEKRRRKEERHEQFQLFREKLEEFVSCPVNKKFVSIKRVEKVLTTFKEILSSDRKVVKETEDKLKNKDEKIQEFRRKLQQSAALVDDQNLNVTGWSEISSDLELEHIHDSTKVRSTCQRTIEKINDELGLKIEQIIAWVEAHAIICATAANYYHDVREIKRKIRNSQSSLIIQLACSLIDIPTERLQETFIAQKQTLFEDTRRRIQSLVQEELIVLKNKFEKEIENEEVQFTKEFGENSRKNKSISKLERKLVKQNLHLELLKRRTSLATVECE